MHQQLLKAGFGYLLAGASLLGCSSPEPVARAKLGVIGGSETGDDYAGVVYVTAEITNVGGSRVAKAGSGSLLAPNLIATALHVVSRNPSNVPFTCDATGNDVSGSQGSQLGATVAPEKVAIYLGPLPDGEPVAHGRQLVTSGSTTICENDIAFVVLDQPLDLPSFPVHRGAPADVGDVLTTVGFGGVDTSQLNPRTERKVNVTAVGQWIRTFTVDQGPCEGDSGGPALAPSGELVGVFSTVAVDCSSANAAAKYTDISFFSSLVEDAFDAAEAGSPWGTAGGTAGAPAVEPSAAGAGEAGTESLAPPPSDDGGCALSAGRRTSGSASGWLLVSGLLLVARTRVGRCRAT